VQITLATIADPVPHDTDIAHYSRVWITGRLLDSGDWLRLERGNPRLAIILVRLQRAAQSQPGCGLEDDPDSLAHAAGVDPDDWQETWAALVWPYLVRGESGLVYVRMFLADTVAAVACHQRNQARTQAARQARREKAGGKGESDGPPATPPRHWKAAPASPPNPSPPEPLVAPVPPPVVPEESPAVAAASEAPPASETNGSVAPSPLVGSSPEGAVPPGRSAEEGDRPAPTRAALQQEVERLKRRHRDASEALIRHPDNPEHRRLDTEAWAALQATRQRLAALTEAAEVADPEGG
jgi:hypothetical protein